MHIIDGKALAAQLRQRLAEEIKTLPIRPWLQAILVGDDPASKLYVDLKTKAAKEVGVKFTLARFAMDAPDQDILALIKTSNQNTAIHGILLQLPLPSGHDTDRLVAAIDPNKDVDGFHPENIKRLNEGTATIFPPTHEGILRLIQQTPLSLNGAVASIICNSAIFGEPLARLLMTAGADVRCMRSNDRDVDWIKNSDLIITAVGKARYLTPTMVKNDAVVIDVGASFDAEGKLAGDVDQAAFQDTDVWLSPVPGGTGPMTVVQLMKNVVQLSRQTSTNNHPFGQSSP